jgi:hypothetical protein
MSTEPNTTEKRIAEIERVFVQTLGRTDLKRYIAKLIALCRGSREAAIKECKRTASVALNNIKARSIGEAKSEVDGRYYHGIACADVQVQNALSALLAPHTTEETKTNAE